MICLYLILLIISTWSFWEPWENWKALRGMVLFGGGSKSVLSLACPGSTLNNYLNMQHSNHPLPFSLIPWLSTLVASGTFRELKSLKEHGCQLPRRGWVNPASGPHGLKRRKRRDNRVTFESSLKPGYMLIWLGWRTRAGKGSFPSTLSLWGISRTLMFDCQG